MAWWRLWQKKQHTLDNIDWPKDAYSSARILAGLLLKETPPFSEWHSPETVVPENLTKTIRFAVNGVQLSLYFITIAKNLGRQASRMTRDEFTMTIAKAMESEEMGHMMDSLLSMSEEALVLASESENKVHMQDRDVEIPLDYPLAVFFLVRMQDSPFYQEKDPQFNDADILTAECIEHGRQRAMALLVPMAQAVRFNPESFTEWRWSEKPGAFERQLRRRHNNPLFPQASRVVTGREVYEARLRDEQDQITYRKDAGALLASMKVDLPFDWHPFLNGMREKLDALIEGGAEVGGDIDDAVEALRAARTHIIDTWRTALGTDNEALKALEEAESVMHAPEEVEMLSNEFLRQLGRDDGPIRAEDVVPSLLTESPETIRLVRRFLRDQGETVQQMQAAGAKIVAECVAGGEHIDQAMEKLQALGISS